MSKIVIVPNPDELIGDVWSIYSVPRTIMPVFFDNGQQCYFPIKNSDAEKYEHVFQSVTDVHKFIADNGLSITEEEIE
jgi:hypothetical protein